MATESRRIRRDAFIKSVRPDPKSTEDLVLLHGYIGDSDLAGHIRVYSDATLSDFIELPEQDVLYSDPVSTEEDSLGGSRLWVRKTTVFTAGDPKLVNRVRSSFLEGDLIKAFGSQARVRPPRVVARELPSAFLEQGCRPFSEPFEICHGPTGALDPACQVFETPPATLPSECLKQTCVQPTCKFGCTISGNPIAICRSVNNICQNVAVQAFGPPTHYNYTCKFVVTCNFLYCRYEPQQTDTFRAAATRVRTWCTCAYDINEQTTPATAACTGGGGYTGGFNPYQTANYGY